MLSGAWQCPSCTAVTPPAPGRERATSPSPPTLLTDFVLPITPRDRGSWCRWCIKQSPSVYVSGETGRSNVLSKATGLGSSGHKLGTEAMGSPRHFCGCADPLQPARGPVAMCVVSSGSLEGPRGSVLSQVAPACLGRPRGALREHRGLGSGSTELKALTPGRPVAGERGAPVRGPHGAG